MGSSDNWRRGRIRVLLGVAVLVLGTAGVAVAAPPFVEEDAQSIYVLEGDTVGDYFGWVAANIGDVTGDGADDLLVPAIVDPAGGTIAGRVAVHSGADGSLLANHVGQPLDVLGYAAAGAGDVDADGVPDYVVGAPGPSAAPAPAGRVLVYSGADHTELFELTPTVEDYFGSGVGAAGDVNDDGHDDIIVGANQTDEAGADAGRVLVYSGADGSVLWVRDGRHAGDLFGSGVGLVGDVDHDGVPDVVAAGYGNGGEAFVLSGDDGSVIHRLRPRPGTGSTFGQFFASGAGDVDADGVPDVFIGDYNGGPTDLVGTGVAYVFSGRTGRAIHVLRAEATGDGFGPGRGVGDVDGDGHGDLIVAGYTSSAGAPQAGKAFVISGRNGRTLRTITSTIAGENFGVDALGLGDVNGDGHTDFAVTAVGLAFNGTAPGTVYVIVGTPLGR